MQGLRARRALAELVRLKRVKERIEELDRKYAAGRQTADEAVEWQALRAEYDAKKESAWGNAKAVLAPCGRCGRAHDQSCWHIDCPRHKER